MKQKSYIKNMPITVKQNYLDFFKLSSYVVTIINKTVIA